MRILLAEDDPLLGDGLQAGLRQQGFQVDWVRDGAAAERELLTAGAYAAAVLDLGLPRKDGLDVLATLRERGIATPVLVLTARDRLDVCTFILGRDAFGSEFLERIAARARDGVRVRLLVDGMGAWMGGRRDFAQARQAGVQVLLLAWCEKVVADAGMVRGVEIISKSGR